MAEFRHYACGEPAERRKWLCGVCNQLVCAWCLEHEHGQVQSEAAPEVRDWRMDAYANIKCAEMELAAAAARIGADLPGDAQSHLVAAHVMVGRAESILEMYLTRKRHQEPRE